MKIAVIICEYNPLQKGHVYHIANASQKVGDSVICIMSGNFTQRGELALADKYRRAEWAIKCGADMVVELPPQYVLSTAKYFALGGVKIADKIKGDVTLSFGSEEGNLKVLQDVADFQEDKNFLASLDSFLKAGEGYAKSYAQALAKISPKYSNVLSTPNNILAVEYLKAIKDIKSNITPHTLARLGGGYHSTDSSDYPSATCVRQAWQNGDLSTISQGVPPFVLKYLECTSPKTLLAAYDKLFSLLKFNALGMDLTNIHGVKEGVENRILSTLQTAVSWQDFVNKLATKRYTNAYLLRTLMNILIANTYSADCLQNADVQYVNVLAVGKSKKELLSLFDCQVITKSYDLPADSLIRRADKLYSSVTSNIPEYMQIVER